MKIKFEVAQGRCVYEYEGDNKTLEDAVELLKDDRVISISVIKQTPKQYLKSQRAINDNPELMEV